MYYSQLLQKQQRIHLTVQEFLSDAIAYFDWAHGTPLQEEQVFQFKGVIVRADRAKMRVFTKTAMATFLGMSVSRFDTYKNRGGEWAEAVVRVEQVIRTQKFEGAAAGLLNANLIVRDLGLTDKTDHTVTTTAAEAATITDTSTLRQAAEAYQNALDE